MMSTSNVHVIVGDLGGDHDGGCTSILERNHFLISPSLNMYSLTTMYALRCVCSSPKKIPPKLHYKQFSFVLSTSCLTQSASLGIFPLIDRAPSLIPMVVLMAKIGIGKCIMSIPTHHCNSSILLLHSINISHLFPSKRKNYFLQG